MSERNIFLVGPMAAGKSTIGRRLAQRLGRRFIDSDRVIESRTGADIALIFDLEGEAGFRRRESAILDELTACSGIVLATGGGAILDPGNRRKLSEGGYVVYLKTSVEEQLRRTAYDKKRPLLQTPDKRQRLESLIRIREPLYREIADLVIQTDGRRVQRVVHAIAKHFQQSASTLGQCTETGS